MNYTLTIATARTLSCYLMAAMLVISCRKEKTPAPSDLDENYFVVHDNPNDPVDHARYEFYKSTGIASFYSDTLHKKQVGEIDGKPRYTYITLSLNYSFFDYHTDQIQGGYKLVTDKSLVPDLLDLLRQDLLPKLPATLWIPSILLTDSVWLSGFPMESIQIADGWTSRHGFNTLAICVKNVAAMNSDEKRMYVASMLAGIAEKRLKDLDPEKLQLEFFSITRDAAKPLIALDLYSGVPFMLYFPPNTEPAPNPLGIIKYPRMSLSTVPALRNLVSMPRETDDLRAFLTAAFNYTEQEFTALHPGHSLILKKISLIRNMLLEAGFKLPG